MPQCTFGVTPWDQGKKRTGFHLNAAKTKRSLWQIRTTGDNQVCTSRPAMIHASFHVSGKSYVIALFEPVVIGRFRFSTRICISRPLPKASLQRDSFRTLAAGKLERGAENSPQFSRSQTLRTNIYISFFRTRNACYHTEVAISYNFNEESTQSNIIAAPYCALVMIRTDNSLFVWA